jgi:hypothetical protein
LGNDPNFATTITNSLALKANLNSPALVTPNLGTPSAGVLTNATGLPLGSGITGTLGFGNGGTGATTQQAAINALVGTQTANRLLKSNGTNVVLAQVDLATDVAGNLPAANGGLTTGTQTITGNKTLSSVVIIPNTSYGFNITPSSDTFNTCRFTASDASYWDFGVAPVGSGKAFYISSGTAGGGVTGFQINAANYNLSTSGILSVTNATQSTSTTTGAQIIAGGQAVGGNLNVGGFTSLGDNVAIKKKLLSGTTASTQGGTTWAVHGLNSTKIISITGLIYYQTDGAVPLNSRQANYASVWATNATSIGITNEASNSSGILSKLYYIVIEYIA